MTNYKLNSQEKHKLLTSFPSYNSKSIPVDYIIGVINSNGESYAVELLRMMIGGGTKTNYNEVYEYVIKNKTGRLQATALTAPISNELFDEYYTNVVPDNFKHISYSHQLYRHPDFFIKVWNACRRDRYVMFTYLPDTPDYKNIIMPNASTYEERTHILYEEDRRFGLESLPDALLEFFKNNILNEPVNVRASYARARWADPDALDSLKTDKVRDVINDLAINPYLSDETAEYLIDNHKSPGIRKGLAQTTKSFNILNKIYHSTKSENILKAVMKNPLSKTGGIK